MKRTRSFNPAAESSFSISSGPGTLLRLAGALHLNKPSYTCAFLAARFASLAAFLSLELAFTSNSAVPPAASIFDFALAEK